MEDESLIVWGMNGKDLPLIHGAPLRMICSGWPASVSGKWLSKLLIRDQVHDGEKMMGQSYRVPYEPVVPGSKVADTNHHVNGSSRHKCCCALVVSCIGCWNGWQWNAHWFNRKCIYCDRFRKTRERYRRQEHGDHAAHVGEKRFASDAFDLGHMHNHHVHLL